MGAGVVDIAAQHPQYASQITAAAKTSFLQGDQWAYLVGIIAILLGGALVFFVFPGKKQEQSLLEAYHTQDTAEAMPRPGLKPVGSPPRAKPAPDRATKRAARKSP